PFGSVFWNAQARLTWRVKREQELGDAGFRLALFNKKSNFDRQVAPLAYDVTFADGRVRFQRRDARDVPEIAAGLSVGYRMIPVLRRGPMAMPAIAEELGVKVDTVRMAASRG